MVDIKFEKLGIRESKILVLICVDEVLNYIIDIE